MFLPRKGGKLSIPQVSSHMSMQPCFQGGFPSAPREDLLLHCLLVSHPPIHRVQTGTA